MTHLMWVGATIVAVFSLMPAAALAQTPSSASFRLQAQALTTAGGRSASASFIMQDCVGPESEAPGKSTSASFILFAGCPAAMPAGLAVDDDDGDGVSNGSEDMAPNGGDGNDDGIPDSVQGNVTSLPGAGGVGFQTIEACTDPTCVTACQLRDVHTLTEDDLPYPNPSIFFPFGLLGFTADCPSVAIRILYHGADAVPANAIYTNFGPNPPGSPGNLYYELPGVVFGSDVIGADPAVASARFTLTDGAVGDDTTTDGEIISLGGPAIVLPPAPAPAMGWTGLLIALSLLLAVGGLGMFRTSKES